MRQRVGILVTLVALGAGVLPATTAAHAASAPTLAVGDVTVNESNAGSVTVKIPVELSQAALVPVTVMYAVTANTASAGSDFVAQSAKLKFGAKATSKVVTVTIMGDTGDEPDEIIDVALSGVSAGAVISPTHGVGHVTILNDDAPVAGLAAGVRPADTDYAVSLGDATVVEADAGRHFAYLPVTLSVPATETVTVDVYYSCGTPGAAVLYGGAPSRTLTFTRGQQSTTLTYVIPANTAPSAIVEFVAGITVMIGSVQVDHSGGTIRIIDNDGSAPAQSQRFERVSVAADGSQSHVADSIVTCQANFGSLASAVSSNGRFALFVSGAYNLVPGDTNDEYDVFLRDRVLNTTERVDVANDGSQLSTGATPGAVSDDGRYITFDTTAAEVLPATNTRAVFVRDRLAGTTTLVSVLPDGTPAPGAVVASGLSSDGRFVAFEASNMLYVRDRVSATTIAVASVPASAWNETPLTANGNAIAFISGDATLVSGDTNSYPDVFVRDLTTGTTERVNTTSAGAQESGNNIGPGGSSTNAARLSMSHDGRYVAFWSASPNMVASGSAEFVRDRVAHTTEKVSVGIPTASPLCFGSFGTVSDDGRYVAFYNMCENLTGTKIDKAATGVFLRDRTAGVTTRVDQPASGKLPNNIGDWPMISADGHYVMFHSAATNLVPSDTNQARDVFIRRTH